MNIPVVKQVGGMPGDSTKRLPITLHSDGVGDVVNHEKLTGIKHGHMGKLKNFEDAEKKAGRAALAAASKSKTPKEHLESFYETFGAKDHDRKFIWKHLVIIWTAHGVTWTDVPVETRTA